MLGLWNEIGKRHPWLLVLVVLVAVFVAVAQEVSATPRAIDMRQVSVRAHGDARKACKAHEIVIEFGVKMRKCESWVSWPCYRQSITRPDVGYCYGSILLDDARGYSVICTKLQRYRVTARGSLRAVRTPGWACYRNHGKPLPT